MDAKRYEAKRRELIEALAKLGVMLPSSWQMNEAGVDQLLAGAKTLAKAKLDKARAAADKRSKIERSKPPFGELREVQFSEGRRSRQPRTMAEARAVNQSARRFRRS